MGKLWKSIVRNIKDLGYAIPGRDKLVLSLWLAAILEEDDVATAELTDLFLEEKMDHVASKVAGCVTKSRERLRHIRESRRGRMVDTLKRDCQRYGILQPV